MWTTDVNTQTLINADFCTIELHLKNITDISEYCASLWSRPELKVERWRVNGKLFSSGF